MGVTKDDLMKYATARTADGRYYGEGRVVAYTDAPTVILRSGESERDLSWRADMCEVAPEPDAPPGDPLVVRRTPDGVEVLNAEVLGGRGVLIIPEGVEWVKF